MTSARPVVRVLPRFVLLLYLAPILLARAASVAAEDDGRSSPPPASPGPASPGRQPAPMPRPCGSRSWTGRPGKPTPCRVNVVGPDGNFYQPAENRALALQPDRRVAEDRQGQPRRARRRSATSAGSSTPPATVDGRRPRGDGPRRGLEGARVPARSSTRVESRPGETPRSRSTLDRAVDDGGARLRPGRPAPPLPRARPRPTTR